MRRLVTRLRELAWRAHARLRRGTLERELDDEMRFHRELLARDLERDGLSAAQAREAASRRFGNTLRLRERSADVWGFPQLETVLQDLRYGARALRRAPGFTGVAVCATGLAIGVNCAFFTLVDSLVWKPIPVADASSMVALVTSIANRETNGRFSHAEYMDIAGRTRTLRDVTAFAPGRIALADPAGGRRALAVGAGFVSGNYFAALGGVAERGRVLVAGDDEPDAPPVVVISERLWRSAFAEAAGVVGRDVIVNGVHVTVAGVARRDFIGVTPVVPDVWMPVTVAARLGIIGASLASRTDRFLALHGHLRAGATREQAAAESSPIVADLAQPAPPAGSELADRWVTGVRVLPQTSLVPLDMQTARIALPGFVAVALVLVIACANLAILLLARALARQREVAVRMAVGASRARLVRQLLTESALIAALGAVLGLALANWAVTATAQAVVQRLPISIGTLVLDLHPSGRVYLYTIALGVASVLVFGLVPALHGTSLDLHTSLKGEDRLFGSRLRRSRFRDGLVAGQVAACVVLGVAAATLVRSLRESLRADTNLHVEQVLVATLGIDGSGRTSPRLAAARSELAARSGQLAGVERTARVTEVPFAGAWASLHVAGRDEGLPRVLPYNVVTPGYFKVVGQRLLRGRGFSPADSGASARVAIITAAAARTFWPGREGVGQTLRAVHASETGADVVTPYEVVGVVADARSGSLWADDAAGYVFLLATPRQVAGGDMALLLRSDGSRRDLVPALSRLAADIDPTAPFEATWVTRLLDAQAVPFRYAAAVATMVGALGLALAAVGLYAVVAFSVRQRRREVAVRVALGATPRDVLAAVLRREIRLVVAGLGAGVVLALGEARLLGATGIPFSPVGAGGFVAILLFLLAVALIATAIPARLALRVDPMQALRQE
ncbi:MAG: ADOP family duplicated permease [Gemmatimonadaceae bacterium]